MAFWTDEQLASIDRMLNPRSIAVVGATPRMQYGGRFVAAAMGSMEQGVNVYPVNPRYEEVQGLQCYPSVSALPEAPDVVGGFADGWEDVGGDMCYRRRTLKGMLADALKAWSIPIMTSS